MYRRDRFGGGVKSLSQFIVVDKIDVDKLKQLKQVAPYTYRCCSLWYDIAAKYGISYNALDSIRDDFLEGLLC